MPRRSPTPAHEQDAPSSIDTERTILGAVLLDNKAFHETSDLSCTHFYLPAHQLIFAAMAMLLDAGGAVDIITLKEELTRSQELKAVGGVAYIASLLDGVPHSLALTQYVDIVKEKKRKRDLLLAAHTVIDDINASTSMELASALDMRILALLADDQKQMPVKLSESIKQTWEAIRHGVKGGLSTTIGELDSSIGGLRERQNIVIAGWTASGKTSLATQIAAHNAKHDIPVGFFSYEMGREELELRMLANEAKIPQVRLTAKSLDAKSLEIAQRGVAEMHRWPLWIDDGFHTISELCARGRMLVAKGAKLLVVDYLQLVPAPGDTPRERVNAASAGLRELAKTCRVPILNISQLTRPRPGAHTEPQLFDLKESGNIEQDAHVVLLLYRESGARFDDFTGKDKIIIAKQRSGPVGSIAAYYKPELMRWQWRSHHDQGEN